MLSDGLGYMQQSVSYIQVPGSPNFFLLRKHLIALLRCCN